MGGEPEPRTDGVGYVGVHRQHGVETGRFERVVEIVEPHVPIVEAEETRGFPGGRDGLRADSFSGLMDE